MVSSHLKITEDLDNLMIFNFTQKYQVSTRIMLKDTLLKIQNETKLLGVIINNNLTWEENASKLIKKS